MIFINKMGRIVYVNPRSEEIMGYSRDEFYREDFDFQKLIAPDYLELTRQSFTRHQRGEEVEPYEYALITKEGRRLDAIIATKLIELDGHPVILGIVTDISDRKEAERAVLESESRFRTLAGLCSDSMYEVRLGSEGDFVLEWASEEEGRISDFPVDRPISAADWKAMIHQDDLHVVMAHFETLRSGRSDTAEFRVHTKTGEIRRVRNRCRPAREEGEARVSRIYGVVRDISAEVEHATSLGEREQWYRQLVEQSPTAMVTTQHGCIVFANDACAKLFGTESAQKLIGHHIKDFIPIAESIDLEQHVYSPDEPARLRTTVPAHCARSDGTRIPIKMAAKRVTFHDSPATQFFIDVTGAAQE
jgi:PAS domain S-box-containing protein